MADTSPTDRPRPGEGGGKASRGRLKVALKLALLLGFPLLVLLLIFGTGIYCGATHARSIVAFEARWLGLEGDAAGGGEDKLDEEPGSDAGGADASEVADDAGSPAQGDSGEAPAGDDDAGTSAEEPETGPGAEEPEADTGAEEPSSDTGAEEPELDPSPEPEDRLPAAAPPAVGSELRSQFKHSKVVRVDVLVDPALLVARDDWLTYVDELVRAAALSFERLFGIELRLHGVIVWDAASKLDPAALLDELESREREGADLVIGLVFDDRPPEFERPDWSGAHNGDYALVFADLGRAERYYRNLLRELARVFGAEEVTDLESEAWASGSFMSGAEVEPGRAPVLDPENRGKVIINKQRPFPSKSKPKPE